MDKDELIGAVAHAVDDKITESEATQVIQVVFRAMFKSIQETGELSFPGVGKLSLKKNTTKKLEGSGGHHAPLEYHRVLLSDQTRMHAYHRAIEQLVHPGDVVLDVGSGSGILSMLAAKHGARRVHAVEITNTAQLAKTLVKQNGLEDVVMVHQCDLATLQPIEPVDLVISDFMGSFVIDDGMLNIVQVASRWLKPTGRFCPSRIKLCVAPIGDFDLPQVDVFETPIADLDFSPIAPYTLNTCYVAHLQSDVLLATAQVVKELIPSEPPKRLDASASFRITRPGRLQALAGWFEAELAEGVVLSTQPGVKSHWGQYLFPIPPHEVQEGDVLEVTLCKQDLQAEVPWSWTGSLNRSGQPLAQFDLESWQRLGQR